VEEAAGQQSRAEEVPTEAPQLADALAMPLLEDGEGPSWSRTRRWRDHDAVFLNAGPSESRTTRGPIGGLGVRRTADRKPEAQLRRQRFVYECVARFSGLNMPRMFRYDTALDGLTRRQRKPWLHTKTTTRRRVDAISQTACVSLHAKRR